MLEKKTGIQIMFKISLSCIVSAMPETIATKKISIFKILSTGSRKT